MTNLLTAGDVAKEVGLTPQAIREAARKGRLRVATRTMGGIHLFARDEVERFKRARVEAIAHR